MRAVVVSRTGADFEAEVTDVPDPRPAANEVTVAVEAVAVNYVDLLTMRGEYQFRPTLPYVPGKGPAGVVTAVGPAAGDVHIGDRVIAMVEYGGYAERVTAHQFYRLPPSLPVGAAAALSVSYDTAWMALRERARLQPGESVLVLGAAGAVGLAAVQMAKCMGGGPVFAGVSSAARFAGPRSVGADHCVTLDAGDLRDSIRSQVLELTDGQGVDVVIDTLGGPAFDGAIRSLAWRGRLVVIGFAAGAIPTLRVNYLLLKNIEVSGMQISDYRKRDPDLVQRCYEEIFAWFGAGSLSAPDYTGHAGLSQWRSAVDAVADPARKGRQVLLLAE